ncbi:4-hydroxybenzoate polyprenyltransferase [Yarrowia sp. E02]|nr:4-hydroxybenzoate polyprenyltransferase [Yarrowia sp. E02]
MLALRLARTARPASLRQVTWSHASVPLSRFYSTVDKVNLPKAPSKDELKTPVPEELIEEVKVLENTPLEPVNSDKAAIDLKTQFQAAREAELAAMTLPERFVYSLPKSMIPYARLMRMEKPVGTWLLFNPGVWSIGMAAYMSHAAVGPTLYTLSLFGIGAFIMRSAGCTINDILDRKLDAQVARTFDRPIAAGDVTVKQAVAFLGAQCAAGLGILMLLPMNCWWLGALSMPFVMTYPLFKRFTYYPQAVLSICFTWAALLGPPAMGVWCWPVMLSLWASNFLWCMVYDTIYAHQDKKFDVEAGIKSTALAWGEHSKSVMTVLTLGQLGLLFGAGVYADMGPGFYSAFTWVSYRLGRMIKTVDLDDPVNCGKHFRSNINTGHIMSAGILADWGMRLAGFY